MEKNEIFQIYGTDYKEMTKLLLKAADLSDEIKKAIRKASVRIGIKPNLVTPSPAMYGATTHPEIVAGIIEYLQENGFSDIVILEGSWVGDKTREAFLYCGYQELAQKYRVSLVDTQKDSFHSVKFRGELVNICDCVGKIDFLINVPVLKGHCQTRMTCALKNLKGLIPNKEKRRFHTMGLHKPIAALNACLRQDFIVVDHICGDPDFEEGGNPLVTNGIFAAKDPVLTDALACRILGISPSEVEYIALAEEYGVGSADLSVLKEIKLRQPDKPDEESGSYAKVLTHKAVELNYATEEIDSCSACFSALTAALERLHEEGNLKTLTEEKGLRFCIGQGYRGITEPSENKIGIGSCTSSFERNIPGCPPSPEDIYRFLSRLLS